MRTALIPIIDGSRGRHPGNRTKPSCATRDFVGAMGFPKRVVSAWWPPHDPQPTPLGRNLRKRRVAPVPKWVAFCCLRGAAADPELRRYARTIVEH